MVSLLRRKEGGRRGGGWRGKTEDESAIKRPRKVIHHFLMHLKDVKSSWSKWIFLG
jgi:hypothetical protein